MSFLGCLILGLPLTFSLLDVVDVPFANAHSRSKYQTVDRLAFPHASLGQVQLDLATKLCVLCLRSFLQGFSPQGAAEVEGSLTKHGQV
jgi:hypothetical protein